MTLDYKRSKEYTVPYRTFTDISKEMKQAAIRALDIKNFGVLGWEGVHFEIQFVGNSPHNWVGESFVM